MSLQEHWENAYLRKPPDKLGWYEPRLATSFALITGCNLPKDAAIIDVGGASTLVDDLLDEGYGSIR